MATRLRKEQLESNYIPAGVIMDYGGASAPTGWLLCDGSAISRTTYSSLFSVIGTTYGAGDGSTTFNLPNAKGRVSVMKSTDTEFDTLGETGGEKAHTLTSSESGLPAHTHKLSTLATTGGIYNRPMSSAYYSLYANTTYDDTSIQDNSASDASSAHNNLQPYIVFNKIIKY